MKKVKKKGIYARYVMDMQKNSTYNYNEVVQAWQLSKDFYNKKFTPDLLRAGNLKLQKNVLIFDLPSIVTCKGHCKGCYAIKAERIYKNTRIMRAYHYAIMLQAMVDNNKREYLLNYITLQLQKHAMVYKIPVVRLHGSGDLFSKKYLFFIFDLIEKNKNLHFYTYTKQLTDKQINKINKSYDNFNIVKSIIDNKFVNFGSKDYLQKVESYLQNKKIKYHVCDYGQANQHTCMGNCTKCLSCPYVLFNKH